MMNLDFSKIFDLLAFDPSDPLLFGSSLFLFLFFFLLLFYRVFANNTKVRIGLLIFFSLYFYYKAAGIYFLLLIFSSVFNFYSGKWLFEIENQKNRKFLFISTLVVNLGLLGYFKYTNFFIGIINDISLGSFDPLDIFLPIGISFYTFKSLSYVIDIYMGAMEPTKSIRDFSLFVFFFPNILAGPIDRASEFIPQINQKYSVSNEDIAKALLLIMSGLIKKIVIADYLSLNFIDRVFDAPLRFTGVENLFAMYGYALQIYCDFSGYSDLAIGIALLLGYRLMDNFNYPYKATSIADFWRRWHISLSTWLLDYLFRPLQMKYRDLRIWGNVIGLVVTFVLCGFWHGASWMFLFWGLLHGAYMAIALFLQRPKRALYDKLNLTNTRLLRFGQTFVNFHLLAISFIFFRMDNFESVMEVFSQIVTFFKPGVIPQFIEGYTPTFVIMTIGFVLHFLPESVGEKTEQILAKTPIIGQALLLAVVIWFVAQIRSADLQPFIYFQF